MGTYGISKEEIADLLEEAEENDKMQGDFTEEVMINGAKLFCKRLREKGADIPKK